MARPAKEFQAFDSAMKQLLTVPKAVIAERVEAHRERAAQNPRRRGPKPKSAPKSADHDPADD